MNITKTEIEKVGQEFVVRAWTGDTRCPDGDYFTHHEPDAKCAARKLVGPLKPVYRHISGDELGRPRQRTARVKVLCGIVSKAWARTQVEYRGRRILVPAHALYEDRKTAAARHGRGLGRL